jgi:hypothetical protein
VQKRSKKDIPSRDKGINKAKCRKEAKGIINSSVLLKHTCKTEET